MPTILHEVSIEAKPDVIYRALTEEQGLRGWWTDHVQASPELNSHSHFSFRSGHCKVKIEQLVPQQRVEWICVEQNVNGKSEWVDTRIRFELSPLGDEMTLLVFTHENWKDKTEFFVHCNNRWGELICESLKNYCERGRGKPEIF